MDANFQSLAVYPADVLQLIIQWLETEQVVRTAITAKSWTKLVTTNVTSLKFFPTPLDPRRNTAVKWMQLLGKDLSLERLQVLHLKGSASWETVGPLLAAAPILRELKLTSAASGFTSDISTPLCHALRSHKALRTVTLSDFSLEECRLVPFLPAQLSSLYLVNTGHINERFIGDLVMACPNLSLLDIHTGRKAQVAMVVFSYLKQLTKLESLTVSAIHDVEGHLSPSIPEEWRRTLQWLTRDLPVPPGKRWKKLELGDSFTPDRLYQHLAGDIEFCRSVALHQGIYPTLAVINYHDEPIQAMGDAAQLEFLKFITNELNVEASLPSGPENGEYTSDWASALLQLPPHASAYIVERHFRPVVAKLAVRDGADPNTIASRLFGNFYTPGMIKNDESVANYIRHPTNPLAPGFSTDRLMPAVFYLKHGSTRNALVSRAKATGADLGLGQVFTLEQLDPFYETIAAIAALDPMFFLLNLVPLLSVMPRFNEVLAVARACPLDEETKIKHLTASPLFSDTYESVNELFEVLEMLLSRDGMAVLMKRYILWEPQQSEVMEWLLTRGFKFDHLRTAEGDNWLHFQLKAALELGAEFDTALLAGTNENGNSPLHSYFGAIADAERFESYKQLLEPYMAFVEEKGLMGAKNRKGEIPAAHLEAL